MSTDLQASLQDDLDLEAQRELLESFSAEGGPEKTYPPPPPPPLPPLPGSQRSMAALCTHHFHNLYLY